ncbi:hypothetical protein [Ligilactobacillus salivarius]|uniref:hypothetical protein n=1 Tax=Ligilactobacillus salivarius TaxID=1624 RepID=UPI0009D92494|nr:hypothetical protein [Ligilactobacillus salivarius]OQR18850.1 hypothetical protein B6U39_09605 [Ligilactobacillus salivarius]
MSIFDLDYITDISDTARSRFIVETLADKIADQAKLAAELGLYEIEINYHKTLWFSIDDYSLGKQRIDLYELDLDFFVEPLYAEVVSRGFNMIFTQSSFIGGKQTFIVSWKEPKEQVRVGVFIPALKIKETADKNKGRQELVNELNQKFINFALVDQGEIAVTLHFGFFEVATDESSVVRHPLYRYIKKYEDNLDISVEDNELVEIRYTDDD